MREYENRKATGCFRFTDEQGHPLENTLLRIEQTEHDFLFGCGAFDVLPCTNEKQGDAFLKDRVEKWLGLYNYGTLPFYWGRFEEREGEPGRNASDQRL